MEYKAKVNKAKKKLRGVKLKTGISKLLSAKSAESPKMSKAKSASSVSVPKAKSISSGLKTSTKSAASTSLRGIKSDASTSKVPLSKRVQERKVKMGTSEGLKGERGTDFKINPNSTPQEQATKIDQIRKKLKKIKGY